MNVLILTNENGSNTTEMRLQQELQKRGHMVTLMTLSELEKRADKGCEELPNLIQKLFSSRQTYRVEHVLAPTLAAWLQAHPYDAILPTKIIAAQAVSEVLHSENCTAFTALVSTEYDSLPRKVDLYCDEYLTMSKRAISIMVDWGIPAERIHYIEVSDQTIPALCDKIEQLALQWRKITQSLSQM